MWKKDLDAVEVKKKKEEEDLSEGENVICLDGNKIPSEDFLYT